MERVVVQRYRVLEAVMVVNVLFWFVIGLLAVGRVVFLQKGHLTGALLMFT